MKAYLIYYPEEAVKNQGFIRFFMEAGKEFGINFSYVSHEEYPKRGLPDFVINRTRDAGVSRWYEERGIRVYHSARLTEIGNDKGKTLAFLEEKLPKEVLEQKWAPKTFLLPKELLGKWIEKLSAEKQDTAEASGAMQNDDSGVLAQINAFIRETKDFVVKSVSGHGGSEVFAFSVPEALVPVERMQQYQRSLLEKLRVLEGKDCILQERIPSESKDVRVYVLGNRIYQGILRQGQKDFRSNFSLGGKTEVYHFSEEQEHFIQSVLNAFEGETLGIAGLDFIITKDGRLVFNELEEMVGCRMLYQNTDTNIVRDYVEWLFKQMNG